MKRPEHFVTCGQMKLLEQRADEAGMSYYQMMENAGSRAAEFILSKAPFAGSFAISGTSMDFAKVADSKDGMAKDVEIPNILANNDALLGAEAAVEAASAAHSGTMSDAPHSADNLAYIFCGKGNNGGDGFVVARLLSNAGWNVTVILVDGEPKTEDSITNFRLLADLPITILDMNADNRALMKLKATPDLIVDAIYGTGFKGKLKGNGLKSAIYINKMGSLARGNAENTAGTASDTKDKTPTSGTLIFALDIPSGLGGDLTRQRDLDKAAVRADYTVTFHAKKPVHLKSFAAEYCGEIVIADIGINEAEMMHVEIYDEE